MPILTWSIRRYSLSSLRGQELDNATKSWIKQRGCRTCASIKPYIKGFGGRCIAFNIAPPGKLAWTRSFVDLSLYYIPPILYAATTNHLPEECNDVLDNFVEPWVLSKGGTVLDQQSLLFDGNLWNHPPDYFKDSQNDISSYAKNTKPLVQENIKVHLHPDFERIQTNTEKVIVPSGVRITVKRSRTVEHTVDISWRDLKEGSLEFGLKDIIGTSILNEVEKQKGRSYTKSETLEYEVELSGDNVCQYNLVWTDVWCKGVIEFSKVETTQLIPFKFRERSELEVLPLEEL